MAKGTSISASSFGFEYWLNKAVEWGQTTTFESQQDVCLHLPKLQEFLKQIYEAIQHMNITPVLKLFPLIGQLLGRLCWNPFVVAHEESQQNLLQCLWCLYSAEPENAVELKANEWIWSSLQSLTGVNHGVRSFIQSLQYPEEEYHSKLLTIMVSSLVKELQGYQCDRSSLFLRFVYSTMENGVDRLPPERRRTYSVLCVPIVTLPEVFPLVEALLTCHEDGLDETLSAEFLESVSNGLLQFSLLLHSSLPTEDRFTIWKKIFLSEAAVMSLWLRYLPSLEQAIFHLIETLISHPCASLLEVEAIITDSLLPKAAAYHPSLFRVLDNFFRATLLDSDGHPKIITIIQVFTQCFVQALLQVQPQMPLKLYFPYNHQSLVMALLVHPSEMPSTAWSQHLISIIQILKGIVQDKEGTRTSANLFENWFLLVHFGDWVNVALQQLMTADDISEMLLWLLMFFFEPHMEDQQESNLLENVKSVYSQIKILSNKSMLNLEDLRTALFTGNLYTEQSHLKDLINHLLVSFLLFSAGGHRIAKESVQLFMLAGAATGGISELLASTAHRLKNKRRGASKDDKVQSTIELLQQQILETQSERVQSNHLLH
ncbi:Fanconi anemia group C protein isoform X1 [Carcharodon carcharias]|uniref:Fanconi anemia group C protein isoform X1 n=1 Tax=Carcharodon carcharias TaxID=13397 RepID=UPI001B7D98AE|nr:Fanconi anemia group C protein isoform X1 [Carcharodon carcharias]